MTTMDKSDEFDAEAFARFRADPKRQAMVKRILHDDSDHGEAMSLLVALWKSHVGTTDLQAQLRSLGYSNYPAAVEAADIIRDELERRNVPPRTIEPCIDRSGRRI